MEQIPHFIGGKPSYSGGDCTSPVFNPATGEQSACVPLADAQDVQNAIDAAKAAFPAWASTTPLRRARILNIFQRLDEENSDQFAGAITLDHGEVLSDARGEVQRGLEVIEFATAVPHLLKGKITGNLASGVDSHALRQRLGVVAGITPFDFPVMVPMWMFPVALAARTRLCICGKDHQPP
ncbi:aldehyde dehydrogenase family protein [Sphingobium sp. HBC34]|uniref:Aldehyde dehydrogenase family protein n=1 Tax=Sphingobium cyanobacteriorum TaxID=3063954 RepID=A0ABT8ZT19_9SPHN|nr:aldehyde dehydrogenase family protein [Sphingobium sp. HBC34]MDO7837382.1 aldehyde dehydrogenase family protein [Sphingobium sp. HBC34]